MTKFYSLIQDWDCTIRDAVDSVTDDLFLTPAERATLLSAGAVVINNLIMEPLIVQIEPEPEDYKHYELLRVNDYGVVRWTDERGYVQL